MSVRSFREAFCERFQCAPEQFERKALAKTLYPHARVVAWFFFLIDSDMRQGTLALMQRAGEARSVRDLAGAMDDYRSWVKMTQSLVMNQGKVRVSGTRLMELGAKVFGVKAVRK